MKIPPTKSSFTYKDHYSYLFEGENQDLTLNKLKKHNLEKPNDIINNPEDVCKKILNIDKTDTKKHSPKLADYYIENKNLNLIQSYYDRFINSKLKTKNIYDYKTFHDFELAVDAADVSIEGGVPIDVNGTPIYEDDDVRIFKGDSQKACVKYGSGYSFCISNTNLASNLFYSYRLRDKLTAYFIRFTKKTSLGIKKLNTFINPLHLIVLHVGYKSMMWTGADNGKQQNGTKSTTKENLIEKFPELKIPFESGKLVCDDYNEIEQDILNHIHNKEVTDEDFELFKPRIRTAYIQFGRELSDKKWDVCVEEQRYMYVNGGGYDLTQYQKQSMGGDKKFMDNYSRVLKNRVDLKLKNKNDRLTADELDEASKDPEFFRAKLDNNERIVKDLIESGHISSDSWNLMGIELYFKLPKNIPKDVTSYFDCNSNQLTSLVGTPERVGDYFSCGHNKLKSLEGCPKHVGSSFSCNDNRLTSLVGAPERVGGNFDCNDNRLTSLVGVTKEIGGHFECNGNKLTTLEGCPENVGGSFSFGYNELTSLSGSPNYVGDSFSCGNNKLTSLVGAPKYVKRHFFCHNNQLTSLEGCPENVGGDFECHDNKLESLVGAPKYVSSFNCNANKLKNLEGAPMIIKSNFICSNNQLESLVGAPKEYIGREFNCSNNELKNLVGAPKHIGRSFSCINNLLTSLSGSPEYVGGDFDCRGNSKQFTQAEVRAVCKVVGNIYV